MRRALLLAWLTGLSAIFAVGSASGAVFCVNKTPCLGTPQATIQEALEVADSNGSEDSIFVGANGGTPYSETLFYNSGETVHVIGDGIGQTVIEGPASDQNAVILLSPSSTISGLTIRAPDVPSGAALAWDGTASNIEAVHLGAAATNTVGMRAEGTAVLEGSTVRMNGFGLFDVGATTGEGVTIRDSTLIGQSGIDGVGGDLTISRSTVASVRSPVQTGTGNLTVENSELKLTGSVFGDGAISALSGADVLARHLTMIGSGSGGGVYADATSGSSEVEVYDSIINNFQYALRCFGELPFTTTLSVSYSAMRR
jgi:hypothetical protein